MTVLESVLNILGNLFVQLVFTVGFIMLYGGFISLCNRCFYDACGDTAFGVVRITGYIGTPVHELSHALMCLLFGHTVKKIRMFGDSKRSRTLGYVEHSYYRDNFYHQLGNFFIGISPIVAGGLVILALVRLLVPHIYFDMTAETAAIGAAFSHGFDGEAVRAFFGSLGSMLTAMFSFSRLADWRWWLCMVLAFSVALHMEISRSDIVSGLRGFGVILVMLLIADTVLGLLFPGALLAVTSACVSVGIFMALFMIIPAVFSSLIGVASLIMILIRESARSIRNDRAEPAVNHHFVPTRRNSEYNGKNKK